MNEQNFSAIPAAACIMRAGEFQLGDNGEGAKTAPLSMLCRSSQPIEHWFWGRVVHDMAGMHLHKSRVAVDYVHDEKEVVGYLNKFESQADGLHASGALVPFKDSDRATEIVHKMKAGVPYEASINFGGDGMKIQEVEAGQVADVNGYSFSGPGIIIREWPLRGVAVCPYGADSNTESRAFSNAKTFSAVVAVDLAPVSQTTPTEERKMSESVEVAAQVVEAAAAEVKTEDNKPAEEATEAAPAAVEAAPVEAVNMQQAMAETPDTFSATEFGRIVGEFGAEIAAQTVAAKGTYESALKLAYDNAKAELKELRGRVTEFEANKTGTPVKVTAHPKESKKSGLFNTGK